MREMGEWCGEVGDEAGSARERRAAVEEAAPSAARGRGRADRWAPPISASEREGGWVDFERGREKLAGSAGRNGMAVQEGEKGEKERKRKKRNF